jgi:hypothetical protein
MMRLLKVHDKKPTKVEFKNIKTLIRLRSLLF